MMTSHLHAQVLSIMLMGALCLVAWMEVPRQAVAILGPRVVVSTALFVAYALGPLYDILQPDDIPVVALDSEYVSQALVYVALWLVMFWLGVSIIRDNEYGWQDARWGMPVNLSPNDIKMIASLLLSIQLICLIAGVSEYGWKAAITGFRAAASSAQWHVSDVERARTMLGKALIHFTTLAAGALHGYSVRRRLGHYWFLRLSILPCILLELMYLSRATLIPVGIFWVTSTLVRGRFGRRDILHGFCMAAIVIAGLAVVWSLRSGDVGGTGGLASLSSIASTKEVTVGDLVASVSGTEKLGLCFEIGRQQHPWDGLISCLYHMNPLPSFLGYFQPKDNTIGLTAYLRQEGISGKITPAFGELYMKIGWSSVASGFMVGVGFGFVWRWVRKAPRLPLGSGISAAALYASCLNGIVLMVHSNIRSATRQVLWVLGLVMLLRLVEFGQGKVRTRIRCVQW